MDSETYNNNLLGKTSFFTLFSKQNNLNSINLQFIISNLITLFKTKK